MFRALRAFIWVCWLVAAGFLNLVVPPASSAPVGPGFRAGVSAPSSSLNLGLYAPVFILTTCLIAGLVFCILVPVFLFLGSPGKQPPRGQKHCGCGCLMAEIDTHPTCRKCRLKNGDACTQENPCGFSKSWLPSVWEKLSKTRSYSSRKSSTGSEGTEKRSPSSSAAGGQRK